MKGDPVAGKAVFETKGGCLRCHQVDGAGATVGPDLSYAGRLPVENLKAKILNPNQPGFGATSGRNGRAARAAANNAPATVTLKTKDGRELRGVRRAEDPLNVFMVDTSGQYDSFEKAEFG